MLIDENKPNNLVDGNILFIILNFYIVPIFNINIGLINLYPISMLLIAKIKK